MSLETFQSAHPLSQAPSMENKRLIWGLSGLLRKIEDINSDPALVDLIKACRSITEGEASFVEESCTPQTPIQNQIVRDTLMDNVLSKKARMMSGKTAGCFLKMIAEISGARKIMEIGTFTGFSAVTLAETKHCEEMVCLEIDPDMEDFIKVRINGTSLENKIHIMIGPAQESLVKLKAEKKTFDLIYIDANKDGYLGYYQYIMDNGLLDNTTGVIICDNILWKNSTVDQSTPGGKALHEFVQFVRQDQRVMQMVIPVSDGVFMIKADKGIPK